MNGMNIYGYSSTLDVVECDKAPFTRELIEDFLVALCEAIDMEREDLHFWDYDGDPYGYDTAPEHLKGISAVQFIKTSSIAVHTLDDLEVVFIDLFSCKNYDADVVREMVEEHFGGIVRHMNTFQRRY